MSESGIIAFMKNMLPVLLIVAAACGNGGEAGPAAAKPNAAPAPDLPASPVFRGHVLDERKKPIEGARARAHLPWGAGADGIRGIKTATDARGEFTLDVEGELRPGADAPVLIVVRAEGYVAWSHMIESFRPGIGQTLWITLTRAGSLRGRVMSTEGEAVDGAFVFVIPPEVAGVAEEREVLSARSGDDGAFRIVGIPPGKFDVGVSAPGYVPSLRGPVTISAGKEAEVPEIMVRRGETIAGRVVTPEGTPVAKARVSAFRGSAYKIYRLYGRSAIEQAGARTESDAEGRFALTGLAPGEYTVAAEAIGHHVVDASRPGVAPGAADVELVLARDTNIFLDIQDRATGTPVPRFTLIITPLSDRSYLVQENEVTSPAGTFTFAALPGVEYKLEILAEGFDVATEKVGPAEEGQNLSATIALESRK